ncbi:MAG: SDR family oxidoreductase [Alphaproteobacteria bacterium]|nr:SDR family oxidoreductase [Alphaproteobacteria bacterium]
MRALVTGAGRRVGRAIALELGTTGWDVLVHYHRSAEPALEAVDAIRAAGGQADVVQGDLGEVEGCAQVVRAVSERWDGLELLVNNASVFEPRPFEQTDLAHWDWMVNVNLRAPFLLARDLLGLLRAGRLAGGTNGCVVNLCDIGADRPVSGFTAYSVSKAGLVMLTRSMAVELAPSVRTVGVAPGQVAWPESYSDEKRAAIARRIPMGRAGTPEDVARLVRFLAMEGDYLNGVIVPVDGGLHVRY